ncbi:MAG: hypothetical protein AAF603_03785 [Pseudomonadota bacterium]
MTQTVKIIRPDWTPLSPAVRWLTTGQSFLSYEDADALDDWSDVEDDKYKNGRQKLLLLARQEEIKTRTDLYIRNHRSANYEDFPDLEPDAFWSDLIDKYSSMLDDCEEGEKAVEINVPLPAHLLRNDRLAWTWNECYSSNGKIEIVYKPICVDGAALFDLYKKDDTPKSVDLKATERNTLLKLIGVMAIKGYGYDPDAQRNEAIKDIANDLDLLGHSLDGKTIRKWLREATALISKNTK